MTKKDYEAIAKVIHRCLLGERPYDEWEAGFVAGARSIALDLTQIFEADNPRFDREKFLRACGV